MSRMLTILYVPYEAIGHVNASISTAQRLRDRGHRIVFAIDETWKGRLSIYGFEEELFKDPEKESIVDPSAYWSNLLYKIGAMKSRPPVEKVCLIRSNILNIRMNYIAKVDKIMEEILSRIKPDIIVIDNYLALPSLVGSGIPWVLSCSFNPIQFIEDERTPPPCSGMSRYF